MKRFLHPLFILICSFHLTSKAQLCTGTLGAPIFKQTFGAGTGSGGALPAGTTTYTYTAGWPSDGQYTIANTSNPPPGNAHWYSGKDHTGDTDGYMFVVNASYAPGEFFRFTVKELCANTTYVFSAWIANVDNINTIDFCKDNDPPYVYTNVLFKVEKPGTTQIDSISTGNIAPAATNIEWKEFGFTFSTGPGQTTVDLVMVNNSPGGCGNDLVIDDISFRPCGPTTSINAVPSKQYYCSGDSLILDAVIGPGYSNPVFQWQYSNDGGVNWTDIPGALKEDLKLNPIAKDQEGQYRLVLAEKGNIHLPKCRIITDPITVNVKKGPAISATSSPASVCMGNSSTLTATGADSYEWSTGDKANTTVVHPSTTSTYTVTGKDAATGCTSKTTVNVVINGFPISPVVTQPDSICPGGAAKLKATAPGGTYKWYEVATGGTPIYTGDTYQTPILTSNKTYYVEVVSTDSCTSVTRTPVKVYLNAGPVSPTIAGKDTICPGKTATLTAIAPGGVYKWYDSPTGGTPFFTGPTYQTPVLTGTKTYYVEVVTPDQCTSTTRTPARVTIAEVIAQFIATPPRGTAPLNVSFTNQSTGATSYHWFFEPPYESILKDPSHTYSNSGEEELNYEVTLIAKNALGCADTTKLSIRIDPLSELVIPNVFTPNGDGINDLFTLQSKALRFVKAELYNSWGLKLYEWNAVHGGWDGRTETGMEVPQGIYYYIIIAIGVDGKEYRLNGPFTLLR